MIHFHMQLLSTFKSPQVTRGHTSPFVAVFVFLFDVVIVVVASFVVVVVVFVVVIVVIVVGDASASSVISSLVFRKESAPL